MEKIMKKRIVAKIDRCVGCHTCELACAIEHSSSNDIERMMLNQENPGYRVNVEAYSSRAIPLHCQHCEEPACVMACPSGAIHRAGEGGPVLYDRERCIGCMMCVQACPFGAIAIAPSGKTVLKCDLCVHRLAEHREPACVEACPTKAIELVFPESTTDEKRKRVAEQMAAAQEAGTNA
jgi:carbon-monoxide dehydrogenase iron sulfur subunit